MVRDGPVTQPAASLGERLKAAQRSVFDKMIPAVKTELRAYADGLRDELRDYVDNQITPQLRSYADNIKTQVQTYVDNQITQTQTQSKTYVDNRDNALDAKIASLVTKNGLIPP